MMKAGVYIMQMVLGETYIKKGAEGNMNKVESKKK